MDHQILAEIWGPAHAEDVQDLRVFIGRIRARLKDGPAAPRFILNEPGAGYRFIAEEAGRRSTVGSRWRKIGRTLSRRAAAAARP